MQEDNSSEDIQKINRLLFPLVYGEGTKGNAVADSLFKKAIQYSRDKECLFRDSDYNQEQITLSLTKASRYPNEIHLSLVIIFLCEYGCAIKLIKLTPQSNIDVKIICLEGWQTGAPDFRADRFELVNPEGKTSLFTPTFMKSDIRLEDFARQFHDQLKKEFNLLDSENRTINQYYVRNYTLKELEYAVKRIIKYRFIGNQYFQYTPNKNPSEEGNKQKQKFKISGRSQSVFDSEADVAWYLVRAIIIDLIGSQGEQKIIAEKFIVGFRGHYLKKATKLFKQYKRSNVEKYMKCLNEIVLDYKHKVSKANINYDNFLQLIKQIKNNIIDIKKGELTSSIQDKQHFYKQKLNYAQSQTLSILQIPKNGLKVDAIQTKAIPSFPVSVKQRYMFQQLITLYKSSKAQTQQETRLDFLDKWVLLVERSIFCLAEQLNNKDRFIDMDLHMRQIQISIGKSSLLELAIIFQEQVRRDLYHYGMLLEGQAESHIQLVKTILAIVAFQAVKLNRQHKVGKLDPYRIPLKIDDFYSKFQSNSYQARKAINHIKAYDKYRQNGRTPIFVMGKDDASFYEFGRLVAQQTRQAINWITIMKKMTTTQREKAFQNLSRQHLENQINQIRTNIVAHTQSNLSQIGVIIINTILGLSTGYSVPLPYNYYQQKDPWLYAFLNNIPSDVLGLIKILYQAQNPNQNGAALNNNTNVVFTNCNFLNKQQRSFQIYVQKTNSPHANLMFNTQLDKIPDLQLTNKICLYYDGKSECSNYKDAKFFVEIKKYDCEKGNGQLTSQLLKFISPPKADQMNREHETYSQMQNRPEQIDIECYQAMCNVRAAYHTQITLLCSNILQRKIVSNSYDVCCRFAERLVLQTGSSLAAYNKNVQKKFGKIQQLIREFEKVWAHSDATFCPILVPLISFLGREIIDDGLIQSEKIREQIRNVPYFLSKKCWKQFQRLQHQILQDPKQKQRWNQRYVLMAAICCFRETEVIQQQQIIYFIKLIFQLRTTKILSDSQTKPQNKRVFQRQLQFSVKKAIYYNIKYLSDYIKDNSLKLNEIIKTIDEGLPMETQWYRVNNNLFQFRGVSSRSKDIYQLDICMGIIRKNGKEIQCLSATIKQNQYYKQIFGKDRELQVYHSSQSFFYQTKQNYKHFFKLAEDPLHKKYVRFQFSEGGQIFRYSVETQSQKNLIIQRQIWTLIPRKTLQLSNCNIPTLYLKEYLAWFSDTKRVIVFRKKELKDMYEIGIVLFLEKHNFQIIGASHIVYHGNYQNQNIGQICDKDCSKYEEIVLRKSLENVKPFQVLSKFEDAEFILELINRQTKDRYYFLHRYQMRFKVVEQRRLLSETYYGYALDYVFVGQDDSLFNKIPCLVLEKYSKDSILLNSHRRILILSDGIVKQQGKIFKSNKPELRYDSFKYDIHDFFGDLRGQNRRSILHLASLMLSINDNIKIKSIQMTPLQYCMYLMKSCFTNRPFSKDEGEKLNNLFDLASASDEVMLLGQCMWRMSISLKQILPFPLLTQSVSKETYFRYEQPFRKCRTLYEKKYNSNKIKYRQKIDKQFLQYIGYKSNESKQYLGIISQALVDQQGQSESQQQDKKKLKKQFSQQYQQVWREVPIYYGNNEHVKKLKSINNLYDKFKKLSQTILIWSNQNQKFQKCSTNFPEQIKNMERNNPQDEVQKEMIKQLQNSYNVYLQEQQRIKIIRDNFEKTLKQNQIATIKSLQQKAQQIIQLIQGKKGIIEQIKQQNENHPDVIIGIRPTLSPAMYTSILCSDTLKDYFPKISKDAGLKLIEVIKIWLALKTRIGSFERMLLLLNHKKDEKLDCVAFMREVLSPRNKIFSVEQWLCFQAQMKVQLWSSQLQTYEDLMAAKSGQFCQLNMGQGKTQVIIPLMILNKIYKKNSDIGLKQIPRVILLSSLFQQARGNFFKFLSVTGFQIPCFELPFNRKVYLVKNDINQITNLIDAFSNKVCILMTRESRLSQILRFQQGKIIHKNLKSYREDHKQKDPKFRFDFSKEDCLGQLIKNRVFDIFDQIDALMNCNKSYIYSIGGHVESKHDDMRYEIIRVTIEVFLKKCLESYISKKYVLVDGKDNQAFEMIRNGEYPLGLQLLLLSDRQKMEELRQSIAQQVIYSRNLHYFSFIKCYETLADRSALLKYVTIPSEQCNLSSEIPEDSKPQIYLLRGLFAYGILQHCLSMRCGVDFGVPNKNNLKKIAVPYQAADIPSRTSQFQHIDVSIILSYISYFLKGLDKDQIKQCLEVLLLMSETSRKKQYEKWIEFLPENKENRENNREEFQLKTVDKIIFNSKVHRQILYQTFHKNRNTIAFWLTKCVFPRDLKKYKTSITASAWDLANVNQSVGFSGTKDNRWLYSNKLKYLPSNTPDIEGTDGKMVFLISVFTNKVCLIEEDDNKIQKKRDYIEKDNNKNAQQEEVSKQNTNKVDSNKNILWKRFVGLALSQKVGCIIDAGALCVGKSLRKEIVPWIAEHLYIKEKYLGVTFCDVDGTWWIYDLQSKFYVLRGTTIPDDKTFVVFDQARTRGADIKMDSNVVAALSIGPGLSKDSLMQAAGRLRKFGRDQKLIIMATHEVFECLPNFPKERNLQHEYINRNQQLFPKQIITYCCQNSIKQNKNLFLQFAELGWKHVYSKIFDVARQQNLKIELKEMYMEKIEQKTILEITKGEYDPHQYQLMIKDQAGEHIVKQLSKYGGGQLRQSGGFNNVCQRQVEIYKTPEIGRELATVSLVAIDQTDPPKQIYKTLEKYPFSFNRKFSMTSNLINTTQPYQIPQLYFLRIKIKANQEQMTAISIREASNFIKQYIVSGSASPQQSIYFLNSLDLNSAVIKDHLKQALVSAKFLAGEENYSLQEQDILLKMCIASQRQKEGWQRNTDSRRQLLVMFLKQKRTLIKKFNGSTLENLVIRLTNEGG